MALSFGLLAPLDQAAIRYAVNGEKWAKERIAEFNEDQRYLAGLICQWYFQTTLDQIVAVNSQS